MADASCIVACVVGCSRRGVGIDGDADEDVGAWHRRVSLAASNAMITDTVIVMLHWWCNTNNHTARDENEIRSKCKVQGTGGALVGPPARGEIGEAMWPLEDGAPNVFLRDCVKRKGE